MPIDPSVEADHQAKVSRTDSCVYPGLHTFDWAQKSVVRLKYMCKHRVDAGENQR